LLSTVVSEIGVEILPSRCVPYSQVKKNSEILSGITLEISG